MKLAADFRSTAREALRRKWVLAVIVGLVATLLCGGGAGGQGGLEISLDLDADYFRWKEEKEEGKKEDSKDKTTKEKAERLQNLLKNLTSGKK